MAVRGIIGAFSKNNRPDLVPNDTLMDWYDNIHIPDVIATSGINTALRFDSLDAGAKYPWLVVYPVADINFAKTEEFDKIPKGGHKEIGGQMFTDLAELDLRICARLNVFEPAGASAGRAPYLVAESIQTANGAEADFEKWYNEEYWPKLATLPGLRRVTRYKLVVSLAEDSPRQLAFFEFNTADIPRKQIAEARDTGKDRAALFHAPLIDDVAYKLVKEAGHLAETL